MITLRKEDLFFSELIDFWCYNTEYCEFYVSSNLQEFIVYYKSRDKYHSGSLIYDGEIFNLLIDYDYFFELPEEIIAMLRVLGIDCNYFD